MKVCLNHKAEEDIALKNLKFAAAFVLSTSMCMSIALPVYAQTAQGCKKVAAAENPSTRNADQNTALAAAENPSTRNADQNTALAAAENPSTRNADQNTALAAAENPSTRNADQNTALAAAENPSTRNAQLAAAGVKPCR